MSNGSITQLAVGAAALLSLAAFVALVVVPAVSAYQRTWERLVAGLLSLWVLGALAGVGVLAGGLVIYEWPHFF
jgi:hypothetical protein